MTTIAMLAYTCMHSYNHIQKLFAVYFEFNGLSACAFDALHLLGLTMSMKWTTDCIADLAVDAKKDLLSL